ncbi:MAG: LysM peptidoglycan-binding domain-containing protein [Pirellulaceae bacterium]|nr:LysM peptidoglycan-binding domain-containing protein [Pirellulaceae bacterium]
METLKTAFVVVLLLVVLYGVYALVTKDASTGPPPDFEFAMEGELEPPTIEGGGLPMGPGQEGEASEWTDPLAGPSTAPPATVADTSAPYADQGSQLADGGSTTAPGSETIGGTNQLLPPPEGYGQVDGGFQPDLPAADTANQDIEAAPGGTTGSSGSRFGGTPAADNTAYDATGTRYGGDAVGGGRFNGYGETGQDTVAERGADTATSLPSVGGEGQYGIQTRNPADTQTLTPGGSPFPAAKARANALLQQGKFHDALLELSRVFGKQTLTPAEEKELYTMLDPLAAKVVYSREHYLTGPHMVAPGDTLDTIAQRYNVPARLLKKINGVERGNLLLQQEPLKVIEGPLRAEVDLTREWIVVYVNSLYAGRFMISVGADPSPQPGEYTVKAKEPGKAYYSRDGRNLSIGDPSNPYGNWWIDLGGEMCIHGSGSAPSQGLGCISLSPVDAGDIYDILSIGSKVTIRR